MSAPEIDEGPVGPDGLPECLQPAWRRDFPIDWSQAQYVARRDFTKFLVLTSFAFVVGQIWIALQNFWRRRKGRPPIAPIARLDAIPVGGALRFEYPRAGDGCLLYRPDQRTIVAFSQKCTHLSCAVVPDIAKGRLRCPCHEGWFDAASGRPIAGPPRRPLVRVTLEVRGGVVHATGLEAAA
jgi:nitrite reductase/ring-hydroxylating ferredoxin subunit